MASDNGSEKKEQPQHLAFVDERKAKEEAKKNRRLFAPVRNYWKKHGSAHILWLVLGTAALGAVTKGGENIFEFFHKKGRRDNEKITRQDVIISQDQRRVVLGGPYDETTGKTPYGERSNQIARYAAQNGYYGYGYAVPGSSEKNFIAISEHTFFVGSMQADVYRYMQEQRPDLADKVEIWGQANGDIECLQLAMTNQHIQSSDFSSLIKSKKKIIVGVSGSGAVFAVNKLLKSRYPKQVEVKQFPNIASLFNGAVDIVAVLEDPEPYEVDHVNGRFSLLGGTKQMHQAINDENYRFLNLYPKDVNSSAFRYYGYEAKELHYPGEPPVAMMCTQTLMVGHNPHDSSLKNETDALDLSDFKDVMISHHFSKARGEYKNSWLPNEIWKSGFNYLFGDPAPAIKPLPLSYDYPQDNGPKPALQ